MLGPSQLFGDFNNFQPKTPHILIVFLSTPGVILLSMSETPKRRDYVRPDDTEEGKPGGTIQRVRSAIKPRVDGNNFWNKRLRLWQWALIFGGIYLAFRGVKMLLGGE